MRRSRRLAVALAVSGLVAAGGVAASQLAHAQTVAGTCTAPGAEANCNVSETIIAPASISFTVSVNVTNSLPIYSYTLTCYSGSQSSTTTGDGAGQTPYTKTIPLPYANPSSCAVSVTAQVPDANAENQISLTVDYTTSVYVSYIKGYGSKCIDDRGDSSSDGTQVIIWGCNHGDSAQGWSFSGGELQHDGLCANDAANGGSGSKVILWSCNGASNEEWTHTGSDGELVLSLSSHGSLCLDDPAYSKSNGTQLIVYTCKNSSNQHWSV